MRRWSRTSIAMSALTRALIEYFKCPPDFVNMELRDDRSPEAGFFQFGPGLVCYGRSTNRDPSRRVNDELYDAAPDVESAGSINRLPFDPTEVVDNFRLEKYPGIQGSWIRVAGKEAYYQLRPFLHRSVREAIQKFQLRGWERRFFPGWPVDFSVDNIHEQLLLLALRSSSADRIPFIWFWPQGKNGCVIMTHDVEGCAGKDYCVELMDIDESYGIKASFQLVPEGSYEVSHEFLNTIRQRGFEVGLQDLNHDGRLYDDRKEFLRRARLINQYAEEYGANGFRAAVLYRKPEWYDAFEFSFDTSIPNTARLDPQRGGCCTVMPYFIGKILELPVTTIQDYMLFNLLGEKSIELWKVQIASILNRKGLVNFIVHPDYLIDEEIASLYKKLLSHLAEIRSHGMTWFAVPAEVDAWWRQRSQMRLVAANGGQWKVEGKGAERAVVGYARNVEGRLVYELEPSVMHSSVR